MKTPDSPSGSDGSGETAAPPPSGYSIDTWPDATWRLYSDTSVFNARIPRTLHVNYEIMIDKLVADGPPADVTQSILQKWAYPIYFGRATDPLYRLTLTENSAGSAATSGRLLHLPPGARPNSGSDGVMIVIDQPNGLKYHIQRAVVDDAAQTIIGWRGSHRPAYGSGYRSDGVVKDVAPAIPEVIRPEELAAGYVNHTMWLGARCLSGHNEAPMDGFETLGKICPGDTDPDTTRLSIGNLVYLDMTHAEVDVLAEPIYVKAILHGLIDHGAIVVANGGAAWALKFETYEDRTRFGEANPYLAHGVPMDFSFANAVDWQARLKVAAPFAGS